MRWLLTRLVPQPVERSTDVLLTSLALVLLFWQWQRLPGVVWDVKSSAGTLALCGLSWVGWLIVLTLTFRGGDVWNGNLVLFVLHDSGLLGLAALVGLGAVVGQRAWRAIKRDIRGTAGPSQVVPLLAAGGALCFAYQFTHALWLMYPYVYLGLLAAVTERGGDEPDGDQA